MVTSGPVLLHRLHQVRLDERSSTTSVTSLTLAAAMVFSLNNQKIAVVLGIRHLGDDRIHVFTRPLLASSPGAGFKTGRVTKWPHAGHCRQRRRPCIGRRNALTGEKNRACSHDGA